MTDLPWLEPLPLPYMVSPSVPFLEVSTSEVTSESPTMISFFATHIDGASSRARIVFEMGLWVRFSPAYADAETVREADYDWSGRAAAQSWLRIRRDSAPARREMEINRPVRGSLGLRGGRVAVARRARPSDRSHAEGQQAVPALPDPRARLLCRGAGRRLASGKADRTQAYHRGGTGLRRRLAAEPMTVRPPSRPPRSIRLHRAVTIASARWGRPLRGGGVLCELAAESGRHRGR